MNKHLIKYGFFILLAGITLPAAASAGDISAIICNVTVALSGLTGKAIASVAIIALGIGALINKVSWGNAMALCLGIGMIFGATSIMNAIGIQGSCSGSVPFAFSCQGPTANGNLMNADTLAESQGASNNTPTGQQWAAAQQGGIFAKTIYIFKYTIGTTMSAMYCSVADSLRLPLEAAITIFLICFGIMIMSGVTNVTLKEAATLLFKIALVWAFAMDPAWGIGIGYKFFVSFAEEGSNIVLSVINPIADVNGATAPTITAPDQVIAGVFNSSATGSTAGSTVMSALSNVPPICFEILFPLAVLLILFMPFVIIFIALLIIQYIGLFAKALLGYLSALVLISFLFIFAPFFLGFALFRTTMPLFEAWIKNLTSFALQMVVMFGFLALLAILPIGQFFIEILNLLKEYDKTFQIFLATFPMDFCGICDYTITGTSIACNAHGTVADLATPAQATAASQAAAAAGYMLSQPDAQGKLYWVISLLNLLNRSDFAQFVIAQIMALFLIGKVLEDFIKKAPEFSKQLAALPMALTLGGKSDSGSGAAVGYIGMASMEAGFIGLKNGMLSGGSGVNPFRTESGGYTFNPLKVGKNIGTNMTRNPLKAWSNRFEAALIGTRRPILDKTGQVVGYKGREGGIIGSILYGAYDKSTMEGQNATRKIERQRTRVAEQQAKYNEANDRFNQTFDEMQTARQELERITESPMANPEGVALAREVSGLTGQIDTLDTQISQADEKISDLQQQIVALEGSKKPDNAQLSILLTQLDNTRQEQNDLKTQKVAKQAELRTADQALDNLLASQQEAISQMAKEYTLTGNQLEFKKQRLADSEALVAKTEAEGTAMDAASYQAHQGLKENIEKLKMEIPELEKRQAEIKESLGAGGIKSLEQVLLEQQKTGNQEKRLANIGNQLAARKETLANNEALAAQIRAQGWTDNPEAFARLENSIETLKLEIPALEAEQESITRSLEKRKNTSRKQVMVQAEKEEAALQRLAKAENRHSLAQEAANTAEIRFNQAKRKMELKESGAISKAGKGGLFARRYESESGTGTVINRSSLDNYWGDDDETMKELNRMRRNSQEKALYGELRSVYKEGKKSGFFKGGMGYSDDKTVDDMRDTAEARLSGLESSFSNAVANLSAEDRGRLQSRINALHTQVTNAETSGNLSAALGEISNIGTEIAQLAGKK